MMILGMVIGPSFLNIVPETTLNLAPILKDIALVSILFMGGLGISLTKMKQVGRSSILLSMIPAVLEGLVITGCAMLFLDFSLIQGAILGFMMAAVSPAILVPAMVDLIKRKVGQDKAIPQMLLAGVSSESTITITLFTTFLSLYVQQTTTGGTNLMLSRLALIPITLIVSGIVGYLVYKISKPLINHSNKAMIRTAIAFSICLIMRLVENHIQLVIFNSLLAIMVYGFLIHNNLPEHSESISHLMNKIWSIGKLYLFTFVGMMIKPTNVGNFFFVGMLILIISLGVRSFGVLISLIGTNLTWKERLFCMIAYLPKATIQSTLASIPLQVGVAGGGIIEAIAILSVLVTAPIGAIGIKLTSDRLLSLESREKQEGDRYA
jgi:NhaP-type Na+/H+ or K+/H+ antiporter